MRLFAPFLDSLLRLVALCLLGLGSLRIYEELRFTGGLNNAPYVVLLLVLCTFFLVHLILRRKFIDMNQHQSTPAPARHTVPVAQTIHVKAKRSDADPGALLALLDDDDDAAATFEELLDSRERQKRR